MIYGMCPNCGKPIGPLPYDNMTGGMYYCQCVTPNPQTIEDRLEELKNMMIRQHPKVTIDLTKPLDPSYEKMQRACYLCKRLSRINKALNKIIILVGSPATCAKRSLRKTEGRLWSMRANAVDDIVEFGASL